MVAHLETILSSPLSAIGAFLAICSRAPKRLLRNILMRIVGRDPGTSLSITLSTSLFSTAFEHNWRLVIIRPRWISERDAFPYPPPSAIPNESGFTGVLYVNDGANQLPAMPMLHGADAIWIYAHGGGFVAGEARQYHLTYKRWIHKAKRDFGLDLRILIVEYPLSEVEPYPASLRSMASAYKYCLGSGYPADRVFMAGDAAGGNLAISTVFHILEERPMPLPAAVLMLSPWLDLTLEHSRGSPNKITDWATALRINANRLH